MNNDDHFVIWGCSNVQILVSIADARATCAKVVINTNAQLYGQDLSSLISHAQDDNQKKRSKIGELKASAGSITAEDKKKITQNFDKAVTFWRKRKRMANDMIDKILEGGYPKKPKDLMADCGVETDSQCDVSVLISKHPHIFFAATTLYVFGT